MGDIRRYTSFFHDGSITDISHTDNVIIISMESAEMDIEDVKDDITLAKDDRIRGRLHIEGIKNIEINNEPFNEIVKKIYDDGGIFDFEIEQNSIELSIDWVNYPPKPKVDEFSVIKIQAKKIWWENLPGQTGFA